MSIINLHSDDALAYAVHDFDHNSPIKQRLGAAMPNKKYRDESVPSNGMRAYTK